MIYVKGHFMVETDVQQQEQEAVHQRGKEISFEHKGGHAGLAFVELSHLVLKSVGKVPSRTALSTDLS
jgi:hypothetical protein